MKRMTLWLVFVLALCLVSVVNAQDETEDPKQNACYDGGVLEGKCSNWDTEAEIEWAWNCGFYYSAYASGKISREETPETCHILFDTIPEVISEISLCIYLGGGETRVAEAGEYIWLQGSPNTAGNATLHFTKGRSTSPCDSIEPSSIPVIWMQSSAEVSYPDALALCQEADPSQTWNSANLLEAPELTNFNWYCTISI